MRDDGLLAGPMDMDGPRRDTTRYPVILAEPGVRVEHRATGILGAIVEFAPPRLVLRDDQGRDHILRYDDGGVRAAVDGAVAAVALRRPSSNPAAASRTASGSVSPGRVPARVARGSRIWVEGLHDAELVEKVWGDDLRVAGVVVEPLHGADDLPERVRAFGPKPGRRLGVLLDHLVAGTKEANIAAEVRHPDVLVTGHPFVDIWQAVKPSVAGIERWPDVPVGTPWKQGILDGLGLDVSPAEFWRRLLGRVTTWTDLETPLLGAVEELIDFVTE